MRVVIFIGLLAFHHFDLVNAKLRSNRDLGSTTDCSATPTNSFSSLRVCQKECLEVDVSSCQPRPDDPKKYHCVCDAGYEGIPGLGSCPGSCTDIDECQLSPTLLADIGKTPCTGTTDFLCVNDVGTYGCVDPCDTIVNDATMNANYGDECRDDFMKTQCEVMNRMATEDYESLFGAVACSGTDFLCVDLDGGGYKCVNPCDEIASSGVTSYSCSSTDTICDIMQGLEGDFMTIFDLRECPEGNQCTSSRVGGYTCPCNACPNPEFQRQDEDTCVCTCEIIPDCGIFNDSFQTKRELKDCECICPEDKTCASGWNYVEADCACVKSLLPPPPPPPGGL